MPNTPLSRLLPRDEYLIPGTRYFLWRGPSQTAYGGAESYYHAIVLPDHSEFQCQAGYPLQRHYSTDDAHTWARNATVEYLDGDDWVEATREGFVRFFNSDQTVAPLVFLSEEERIQNGEPFPLPPPPKPIHKLGVPKGKLP